MFSHLMLRGSISASRTWSVPTIGNVDVPARKFVLRMCPKTIGSRRGKIHLVGSVSSDIWDSVRSNLCYEKVVQCPALRLIMNVMSTCDTYHVGRKLSQERQD